MKQKNTKENRKQNELTPDELKTVFNKFEDNTFGISEQVQIAIVIMAIFGFRQKELLSLKVNDVALEDNLIHLSDSFQVPIPEVTKELFVRLIGLGDDSAYLIPNPKNKSEPLPNSAMSYSIRKLLPGFKLYSGLPIVY